MSGRGPNWRKAAGSPPAAGILVDHKLRAHHEPHIFAIGDCAEVRCPDPECVECRTARGPSGLVGPGWRQAEWLADYLTLLASGAEAEAEALPSLPAELPGVIVLKARGMNMAVAGDVSADPWDEEALTAGAVNGRARLQIAQWADPEHGRYVKMTTRAGVLEGLVAVGMPRTSAELVQLFERGAELPADRSLLLRLDGPDQAAAAGAADPERTVCRCAGRQRDGDCFCRDRGLRDGGRGIRRPPAPAPAAAAATTTSRGSSRPTFRGRLPEERAS